MGLLLASGAPVEVDRIKDALDGQTFGVTRVVAVRLDTTEDANGDPALFVYVTLANPTDDTWPYEDTLEIRRRVLEVAREIPPIEMPIYISLSPQTDDPQEDDEPRVDAPTLFGD